MLFSVIYTADAPADVNVLDYAPPDVTDWNETEDDDQYEGEDEQGHHRKWCAVLNREQFDDFIQHCGLFAERTETMGSLGAPGFGFGWAPAISFRSDADDAMQNAFVTPIPECRKESCDKRDWRRVRKAVLAVYG
jgi:hypothetical protein